MAHFSERGIRVEADAAASQLAAASVGGLSSRMMVPRNTNDGSWRRGGSTQQFVDGVLPLPSAGQSFAPAPALPSATEVYQQQVAEQQSMVTAGVRPAPEPRVQPFELDAPAAQFAERADVLEARDIHGTTTTTPYVRLRVPVEHQTPRHIAPDGSVVFDEIDSSHMALQRRIRQQSGYVHPAPRDVVGWESAPEVVPQAQPKELHRPIDRSCTVLDEVATAGRGGTGFEPVYKRSYAGWDNKDLEGARPPGSPGDFATTQGRARRNRMAPAEQPVPAASPRHAGGTQDSRYQPSWSPSALAAAPDPARARQPAMPGAYGEPMQERGKKMPDLGSRSNTVWGMMHPEAVSAGDAAGGLSPRSRLR
jgi:hypothetical protein